MPVGTIHPTAILDAPFRHYQGGTEPDDFIYNAGSIGKNVHIGAGSVIGRGVAIGDSVVIDHHCIVEPNASIDQNCLLIYRAIVGCDAVIGRDCVIGGFIAERCVIEANCRVFGQIVHQQADTTKSWDELDEPEPSAVVKERSFIGFGAIIAGGITIGPSAYVCAGTLLTRNVPEKHIAFGTNSIIPVNQWRGKLAQNPIFHQ